MMLQTLRIFSGVLGVSLMLSVGLAGYLSNTRSLTPDQIKIKQAFVELTGLPDLAIMTETRFIRHRSLSDVHSLFNIGPEIRERFSASFVYAPSQAMRSMPSRVTSER